MSWLVMLLEWLFYELLTYQKHPRKEPWGLPTVGANFNISKVRDQLSQKYGETPILYGIELEYVST